MGFSWRGGDVGGLRRLGSGLEPRELRSAAARAVRASFAELDRLEVGASYRSVMHSLSIAEKTAPFSSRVLSRKMCFCLNLELSTILVLLYTTHLLIHIIKHILWVTTQTQLFLITPPKKSPGWGVA